MKSIRLNRIRLSIQIVAILHWMVFLKDCDTRFMPYLIIGVCGSIICYINCKENKKFERNRESGIVFSLSVVFSIITASANYYFLMNSIREKGAVSYLCDICFVLMILLGGFFAAWHILAYVTRRTKDFYWRQVKYRWSAGKVFALSMTAICMFNGFIMFTSYYPGNLCDDSYSSIYQILHGDYSNHHPFYYTMVIRLFIGLGLRWFDDINAAVALYSVFQIVFMAACISYAVVTLYQLNVSRNVILVCWLWYVGMPFHITYSFTMWKDTMFGGFVLVFIVAYFRIWKKIGNHGRCKEVLLFLSGVGMCLFRSNGWFAFLLTFLCFEFLFGENKRGKRICYLLLAVLLFSLILKHPVLKILNVKPADTIEALSVPAQQIARVIRDCDDVGEKHIELLRKIVDVEQIPNFYDAHISDPIKELVRSTGDQEYLVTHKAEYLLLYIEMGLAHSDKYFEAWIDLTKGYWNGGYQYWVWLHKLFENDFGIERTVYLKNVNRGIEEYIWNYYDSPVLQIFLCIGFHVWIIIVVAALCIVRKDKEGLFLTLPVICIVITLIIATPVYAEFRYAYAVFCCIPFVLVAPFCKRNVEITDMEEMIRKHT